MSKQKYHRISLDKCEYIGGDGVEYEYYLDKYSGLTYKVPIYIHRYNTKAELMDVDDGQLDAFFEEGGAIVFDKEVF